MSGSFYRILQLCVLSVGALTTLCRKAKLISNSGKYFSAKKVHVGKSWPRVIWHFPNQWKVGWEVNQTEIKKSRFSSLAALFNIFSQEFTDSKIFKTSAQFCMEMLHRWRLLQRNTLTFSFRASLNRETTQDRHLHSYFLCFIFGT